MMDRMGEFRQDKMALLIVSVLVVLTMVMVGLAMFFEYRARDLDESTLCSKTRPYAHTILVFDTSDSLNDVQKRYLEKYFDRFVDQYVPKGSQKSLADPFHELEPEEKISVYFVDDYRENDFSPEFSKCRPDDGGDSYGLSENPELLKRTWEEKFAGPLRESIENLLAGKNSARSPIMETIQAAVIEGFFQEHNKRKRLIVVSDLIQHTSFYSQYREGADFEEFRRQHARYYHRLKTDMSEVDVSLFFIIRDGIHLSGTNRHRLFWELYFGDQKATVVQIEPVRG